MEYLLLAVGSGLVALSLFQLRRALAGPSSLDQERLTELAEEMLAAAEEASQVVDEKIAQLESLMAMTDGRVARLTEGRADSGGRLGDRGEGSAPAMSRNRARAWAALKGSAEASRLESSRLEPSWNERSRTEPNSATERDRLLGPLPPLQTAEADRERQIYELADQGYDAVTIARKLGLTQGEVQLILSLRDLR